MANPLIDDRLVDLLLRDVLQAERLTALPHFADHGPETFELYLSACRQLARGALASSYRPLDLEPPVFEGGRVRLHPRFGPLFTQLRELGVIAATRPEEVGGQQMPLTVSTLAHTYLMAGNLSVAALAWLTTGAAHLVEAFGDDAVKERFLARMYAGEWTGTMALTEPHAGSSLGDLTTSATPAPDGTYRIRGAKIFISGGDHDVAENVVHLTLARIEGAPEGTKGISLFAVPRLREEGGALVDNDVHVTGVIHKIGWKALPSLALGFGDRGDCHGWLVGAPHQGLRMMFQMMNEARIGVGMQGLAQAEVAYQNALAYARERLQGRAVTGPENPDGPADPLIVHPDIRRSLMDQKSFIEGARAFMLWGAELIDRSHRGGDAAAEGLISLMTPVIKGFLTDEGYDMTVLAQQVYGGHGYIEEWGMSQFTRDARIAMIYEGANGVQALDLVGRKLAQDGGKHVMAFFDLVKTFLKENEGDEGLKKDFLDPLKAASKDLQAAGMFFMQNGMKNPNAALAGSYDFMHLFGHVCLGLMWARMAKAAHAALEAGTSDERFYRAKLATGRFYMTRRLPATALHLARIESGAEPVMALEAEAF